jgi:hypothetical protein
MTKIHWPNPVRGKSAAGSKAASWMNRLLAAARMAAIVDAKGIGCSVKLAQGDDGSTLIVSPLLPQDTAAAAATYYPFKIYKPQSTWLAATGITFNETTGEPINCAIDATQPTALPGRVNPNTDWWRFWAVREGLVSVRSFEFSCFDEQFIFPGAQFLTTSRDFATVIPVSGCDSIGPTHNSVGLGYEQDPSTLDKTYGASVVPIILPGNADAQGFYNYALWVGMESSAGIDVNYSARLKCRRYSAYTQYASAFPNQPDSSHVPVGVISTLGYDWYKAGGTDATKLTVYQIQYGHALDRYGVFNSGNPYFNATLNYRGDWNNDPDLPYLCFYPGDVVKVQEQFDFTAASTGGITTTVGVAGPGGSSASMYVTSLYMSTVVGFTADPATDTNWVKVSGADTVASNDGTPNL